MIKSQKINKVNFTNTNYKLQSHIKGLKESNMNTNTSQFTPLQDDSPSSSIKRFNNQVAPMQFLREAVQNSIEAGAKNIRIEKCPLYLRTQNQTGKLRIIDDGDGMSPDELLKYINKYNSSSKKSNGRHDNFGIGIKATSANFNRYGLVFISWHEDHEDGHMIWLCYNEQYQQFGVRHIDIYEMEDDGELITVPKQVVSLSELKASYPNGYDGVDWWNCESIKGRHKTIHGHGTIVYFLGNSRDQDTWSTDSRGVSLKHTMSSYSQYLATRYWEMGAKIITERSRDTDMGGRERRTSRMRSLQEIAASLRYKFVDLIDCGQGFSVRVLMRDEPLSSRNLQVLENYSRRSKHTNGFVAVKYKNELYNHEWGKSTMRKWGVIADEIMGQVKLIIIPPVYDHKTGYGVFPNEGRDTLLIESKNELGVESKYIDLERVRENFIDNHPQELTDLINEALAKKTSKSHDGHEVLKKYGHLFKLHKAKVKVDEDVCDANGDSQQMLLDCHSPGDKKDKKKEQEKNDKVEKTDEEIQAIKDRLAKMKNASKKPKAKRHPTRVIWEMPTRDDDCKFRGKDGFEYPFAFSRTKEGPIIWGNEDHEYLKSIENYFADFYRGGENQRNLIGSTIEEIAGLQATCVHAHKTQLAKSFPQLKTREQVTKQEFFAKLLGGDLHSKVQRSLSTQGLKKASK